MKRMKTRVNHLRRSFLEYLHEELKQNLASHVPNPGHSSGGACDLALLQNHAGIFIRWST